MNLRQLQLRLLQILGINRIFRNLNAHKAVILWYHGICDDDFTLLKGYDERHIPRSLFKKHLEYLKQKGYRFATMSELTGLLREKKNIDKIVALTFDDGFSNVIKNAYPLMKSMKAKGCLYVVSELAGKQNLLWTDFIEMMVRSRGPAKLEFTFKGEIQAYNLGTKESLETAIKDIKAKLRSISDAERLSHLQQFKLTEAELKKFPQEFLIAGWDQIKRLDKNVLEIGSHTRNHPNCANLTSEAELESELQGSRIDIETQVEYKITNFCYPAGSYNGRVIDHVQKYGYMSATTIVPGFNDNMTPLYELRRIPTNENIWLFKAMVSGSYLFMSNILQKIKGRK